jgi:hypothetical protein
MAARLTGVRGSRYNPAHRREALKVQLAVFGINGPISLNPENPLFIREARLEFHK